MKNIAFVILVSVLFLCSCSGTQSPKFKAMENVKITELTPVNMDIDAEAVFKNPNAKSVTLASIEIDVTVNEIKGATVSKKLGTPVPANAEFRLPVRINMKSAPLFDEFASVIMGIAKHGATKEFTVNYQGTVTFDLDGREVPVVVVHTATVMAENISIN